MKNIKITAALIRKFDPCYDPSKVMPEDEEITLKEAIIKYRNSVKKKDDIIWVLCRKEFMSDKEMRLFTVWCAREALKLVANPDPRSVEACNVAERYANGEATYEEFSVTSDAARAAAWTVGRYATWAPAREVASAACNASRDAAILAASAAARAIAWNAALDAARAIAWNAAKDAQIDKLLTYFE